MQTRDVPEPWASRMVQRGLTRRDGRPNISALARSAGVAVETARRVVHGVGIADAGTVAALATVLGDDIAGWLDWRAEGLDVWEPPSESRLLTREEREVLDRLVRLMVIDRRGHAVLPTVSSEPLDLKGLTSVALDRPHSTTRLEQTRGRMSAAASGEQRAADEDHDVTIEDEQGHPEEP